MARNHRTQPSWKLESRGVQGRAGNLQEPSVASPKQRDPLACTFLLVLATGKLGTKFRTRFNNSAGPVFPTPGFSLHRDMSFSKSDFYS